MKNSLLIVLALVTGIAFADTRPNPPEKRSVAETKRLMALGQQLRCSLSQDFVLQTKDGLRTPDSEKYPRTVLFNSLAPTASSSSDFATYSLSWENQELSFRFYMNSQVGEIRILDEKKGLSAESSLDLSDFAKEEVYVGSARLLQKEDIMVTHPKNGKQVPGEKFSYLRASCQFLEGYTP